MACDVKNFKGSSDQFVIDFLVELTVQQLCEGVIASKEAQKVSLDAIFVWPVKDWHTLYGKSEDATLGIICFVKLNFGFGFSFRMPC